MSSKAQSSSFDSPFITLFCVGQVSQWEPPEAAQLATQEREENGGPPASTDRGGEQERREELPLDTLSSDEEDKDDDSDSDEEQVLILQPFICFLGFHLVSTFSMRNCRLYGPPHAAAQLD
jgi:hypothetical protein